MFLSSSGYKMSRFGGILGRSRVPSTIYSFDLSSPSRASVLVSRHKTLLHGGRCSTIGRTRHFDNIYNNQTRGSIRNSSEACENSTISTENGGKRRNPLKTLVLGSGGFIIGQGGEFNYTCAQCIKALKDEGMEVILVNPNMSTIHTAPTLADKVYFLAVNLDNVQRVIEKEQPDGIIFTFGGSTAKMCGLELHNMGILSKYNINVIGTQIETIKLLSDRDAITSAFKKVNVPHPKSYNVESIEAARNLMKTIDYPVFVRFPYDTRVCGGPHLAKTEGELTKEVSKILATCDYAIVEKSLLHWKEYQYHVLRDMGGNCVAVSSLESINPVGIHTGDSIVVVPAQTLKPGVGDIMLDYSFFLADHFKIIGSCDVKFALNPVTEEFVVTELKPAPSRSSVLSSKANGCATAYIATRLALGASLSTFLNDNAAKDRSNLMSNTNNVVIRFPRWDFNKFTGVSQGLTSVMKSVGEIMAVGSCFEEALQKAIRMAEPCFQGLEVIDFDDIDKALTYPTNLHIFAVYTAIIKHDYSLKKIHELTSIDYWFLERIKNIADVAIELGKNKWLEVSKSEITQPYREYFPYSGEGYFQPPVSATPFKLSPVLLKEAKRIGFSDLHIANITNSTEHLVRSIRLANNITPAFKILNNASSTLRTAKNYIYATYDHSGDKLTKFSARGSVVVLGAGAYRIGTSIESDWCTVSCLKTLRKNGKNTILVNCNPVTLSTDSEACDFLFFEESTLERIVDIYTFTSAESCVLSVGGQTPQILALGLLNAGVKILGTDPVNIDKAEDRKKFSKLLDNVNIKQPKWKEFTTVKDALSFADSVSYPIVIRPSYVVSGSNVSIVYNKEELIRDVKMALEASNKCPVVMSKFMENWREFDVDIIAYEGKILSFSICQHLEYAGTHSGDATIVIPPCMEDKCNTSKETPIWPFKEEYLRETIDVAEKIAKELNIKGAFNIQMILKEASDGKPYVIEVLECNVKSSRSLPLVSKVYDVDFIELSTLAVLGYKDKIKVTPRKLDSLMKDFYCVRAPVFSWKNLKGANPLVGPEMKSTGEVACISKSIESAFLMALSAKHNYGFQNFPPTEDDSIVIMLCDSNRRESYYPIIEKLLNRGHSIISGSPETDEILKLLGVSKFECIEDILNKLDDTSSESRDLVSKLEDMGLMKRFYLNKRVSVAIYLIGSPTTPISSAHKALTRSAVDCGVVHIHDINQATLLVKAMEMHRHNKDSSKDILSWIEWQNQNNSDKND